ncbi:acyl-CoA dehydrogenase family protein [Caproiciproducens sp.]
MMNFELSEGQTTLIQLIRTLNAEKIVPYLREHRFTEKNGFSQYLLDILREHNLLCPVVPKEYGGLGMDYMSVSLVVEEIATVCPGLAFVVSNNVHAVQPILLSGTKEQKQNILPAFTGKEACLGAFASTERASGSDVSSFQSLAEEKDDHYILTGQKEYVLNAGTAKYLTVFSSSSFSKKKASLRCFMIPNFLPHFRLGKVCKVAAPLLFDPMEILFDHVKISKSNVIEDKDYSGYLLLSQTMDMGRALTSAVAVGIARAAFDLADDYARKRVLNGKTIISNQVIAHSLVEMAVMIEMNQLLVRKACWLIDKEEDFAMVSNMSKLSASRLAIEVTSRASEIFGARAFLVTSKIDQLTQCARIISVIDGTDNIQKNTISTIMKVNEI